MTHDDMRDWQLRDIAHSGSLDRPVVANTINVPTNLRLAGEMLVWSWLDLPRHTRPGPGLLDQFVVLADAPAERILTYAQRWGVLLLCEHHLPSSHNPPPLYMSQSGPMWCLPSRDPDNQCWELLEDWRHFARQARALLRVAVRLHEGRTGAAADWGTVYERPAQPGPPGQGDLDAERLALTLLVNEWLVLGNVRPQFWWAEGRNAAPEIRLGGEDLFGALAVQLALAISQTDGLALCSACGSPYVPERRPRPDERHYCAACRDAGRPIRDAARDYRSRQAKEPKPPATRTRSTRSVPKHT